MRFSSHRALVWNFRRFFGRDGDQRPFYLEGFGAVGFSTPAENFANEHSATDTFEGTSPGYITRVTQVNGAVAASLAWAPKSPETSEVVERNGRKINTLLLTRGKSGYDALLKWNIRTRNRTWRDT